jgi:copper chaperone
MGIQEATFSVPGMSCMHCVHAIKSALGRVQGVSSVHVDLASRKVRVNYADEATGREEMVEALAAAGYPVAG